MSDLYIDAVMGRQDFRAAYRRELKARRELSALLAEAREAIPDWSTGVNKDLLNRIAAAVTSADRAP